MSVGDQHPTVPEIQAILDRLGDRIRRTPVWRWQGLPVSRRLGSETELLLKLELFQHAGSFKARGALNNVLALDEAALVRGVTAVSAGNHAIAVAWAARVVGTTAKVVMLEGANPARLEACRSLGAEIVMADFQSAFDCVQRIESEEGRAFIHPFESRGTVEGTATLGLELATQVEGLDAVVVPIGGGGLCAGVATAVKQVQPECRVIGVEPEGADTMHRSFSSGKPERIERSETIADSLAAPYSAPYTLALCRRFVDELVKVDDDQLREAMRWMFADAKLAVEPAAAAAAAAALGPLADRLRGQRVALVVCGTNIDVETLTRLLAT